MSETTAYRNHINNYELETREVFEKETWSPENIHWTLQTDMLTRLDDNQLTRSTDTSKHEETNAQKGIKTGPRTFIVRFVKYIFIGLNIIEKETQEEEKPL